MSVRPIPIVQLAAGLLLAHAGNVSAGASGEIVVDSTADAILTDGNCTLREAVIAANTDTTVDGCAVAGAADTIRLPAGHYAMALAGADNESLVGDFDVLQPLTIVGEGAASTRIDGMGLDRVFEVRPAARLSLRRLAVVAGAATAAGAQILVAATAELELDTVRVADTGAGAGPAIHLLNGGTASIRNSLIEDHPDGALYLQTESAVDVVRSTLRNNAATSGGAVSANGEVTIRDSTLSGNTSTLDGGAILIGSSGGLTMTNSTLTGNQAGRQGGALIVSGLAVIHGSTIARNQAASNAGGIMVPVISGTSGFVLLGNTILAENTLGAGGASDCLGLVLSGGYTLLGSTDGCALETGPGDLTGVDPVLGAFGGFGGPTATIRPGGGSPAIDAGDPAGCRDPDGELLPADQRGFVRVGRCDIGAHEAGSPGPERLFDDGFE